MTSLIFFTPQLNHQIIQILQILFPEYFWIPSFSLHSSRHPQSSASYYRNLYFCTIFWVSESASTSVPCCLLKLFRIQIWSRSFRAKFSSGLPCYLLESLISSFLQSQILEMSFLLSYLSPLLSPLCHKCLVSSDMLRPAVS